MSKNKKFFEERNEQSLVKARIVEKYFHTWSKVIRPAAKQRGSKIAYVDLYAGPGRYKDGAASTPLLVLQTAITDVELGQMLVTVFNDGDKNNSSTLENEIAGLPGINGLRYQPIVKSDPVGPEIEKYFSSIRMVPTFSFIDPFGYIGLSLGLVQAFIKDWGCDTVFFFNYNRINAGLGNPAVEPHLDSLFGKARADALRAELLGLSPSEREARILQRLSEAIKELGGEYVLPFRFKNEQGTRLSHCLVFVSKSPKGYEIMKGIMAKESSTRDQGVASFVYCPSDASNPLLFSLDQPINSLGDALIKKYAGLEFTIQRLYEAHNVDTPFVLQNYQEAIRQLEAAGKVKCTPAAQDRPKRNKVVTMAPHTLVAFPQR